MDQNTFDTFARRAANLFDRRSLIGGLSAALLGTSGLPLAAGAKKGKLHRKHNKGKTKDCKKACKSLDKVAQCCVNVGVCSTAANAAVLLG